MFALTSCEKEKDDYTEKVVGEYSMKITPNISVSYANQSLPVTMETVTTTCEITKVDDKGNVLVAIDGINGVVGEMFFNGYCDGLGMKLENNTYDGVFSTSDYGSAYFDLKLKNPTVSIYSNSSLSWESTVTGSCDINLSGLDNISCDVNGKIRFEAIEK